MAKMPGVLVIDQDADVRYQVQRVIREAGFASAGQAGFGTAGVAAAMEVKPDILLCGIREPVARAAQTIESLAYAFPQTPIIAYAESSDLELIRRAMLAGARDFLRAPFKADELRRSLSAAMESEERRRLRDGGAPVLGPQGAVITVFGAKGGIGKTTVATNLAVAAARAHQSVALVDADDTFGDAAAALALAPERTVQDALRGMNGERELSGEELRKLCSLHDSGLAVLPASPDPLEWKDVSGETVLRLFQHLTRLFDVVVVDTGSTLSDVSLAALRAATLVLWVTSPEYASVRDSLQALQAIRGLGTVDERIRIVLNVVSPEVEVQQSSLEEAFGSPIFWTIPYDRLLRRSTQLGRALVDAKPHSAAALNFRDLASVLTGGTIELRNDGWLARIVGRVNGLWKRSDLDAKEEARL